MNNSKIFTSMSIKRKWVEKINEYSQQKKISKSKIICHILERHMTKLSQLPRCCLHPMKSQNRGGDYVSQHVSIKPELFEQLSCIKLMYRYTLSYLFGDAMIFFDEYMSDYIDFVKKQNVITKREIKYKYIINADVLQNMH